MLFIVLFLLVAIIPWCVNLFFEFDIENKKFRTGCYLWGLKIGGKWKNLVIENEDLIVLSKSKMSQSMYYGIGVINTNVKYFVYNLRFQNSDGKYESFIFSSYRKEVGNLIKLAEQISKKYDIRFENHLA